MRAMLIGTFLALVLCASYAPPVEAAKLVSSGTGRGISGLYKGTASVWDENWTNYDALFYWSVSGWLSVDSDGRRAGRNPLIGLQVDNKTIFRTDDSTFNWWRRVYHQYGSEYLIVADGRYVEHNSAGGIDPIRKETRVICDVLFDTSTGTGSGSCTVIVYDFYWGTYTITSNTRYELNFSS